MTASSDIPSLFSEEELPRKTTRRKTASSKAEASSVAVKTPKATKATKADSKATKTTKTKASTKAEPEVEAEPVKKTTKRRATAATAPVEETASEPKAAKEVKKRTTTRKTVKAAEEAPVAKPVEVEPAPAPEAKTPRKRASRASKDSEAASAASAAKTAAATAKVQSASREAEEWKPGAKSAAAAPVEPKTEVPQHEEKREPVVKAEAAPLPEAREARGEGEERSGERDNREGRGNEGRYDRYSRHHRNRNFRGRDRHFRDRGNRYDRGSTEEGDSRAAAPRRDSDAPEYQEVPLDPNAPRPEPVFAEGIVEVSGKGFGFLRDPKRNFSQHPSDIFVTPEVCRRYTLRDGMWIRGEIRRGNRGLQLYKLTAIEGEDPEKCRIIPMFEELTTINPNRFIKLETTPERFTTRVIDMMAPIGRGQRGLIVAPPRTGKTTLLQHIAEAIVTNHPEMKLIILLVDERPEEVTEIRRTVPQAEIMASSNDMDIKSHTRIAQLAIERAKRLVEMGKPVFVLLDSITRLGRAFNNAQGGGGRTMSGGVDARALEIPRKLFAAARNTEEAGSLTIVATALIETGSRMDDLIFQEFKGTGNMELVLDRKISDLRIYPAVDIFQSGTRREELLLPESDLHKINIIRRGLAGHKPAEAIERLLSFMKRFPTNAQLLREIPG